jgi:hypothetical protein
MVNLALKSKIVARYRIQGAAAKSLRMSESRLSRIVTGLSEPTEEELQNFVDMLGEDVRLAFEHQRVDATKAGRGVAAILADQTGTVLGLRGAPEKS